MKRLFSLALAVGCFVTLVPIGRAQDDGGATPAPAAERKATDGRDHRHAA